MKSDSKYLVYFFLGTIIWTWSFHFPIIYFHLDWSKGVGLILFLAGGPAPSLMGIIMVLKTYTPCQQKDFFIRCIDPQRIRLWFFFPSLLFPMMAVISILLDYAKTNAIPGMAAMTILKSNPLMFLGLLFLYLGSGPLNEELGWRGYALDILLVKFGFLRGSVILGLIWGIWHLPWCFMAGQVQSLDTFWLYILSLVGLSLVISLVYVKTNRSILAAIWMHFSSNLFTSQLLSPTSAQYEIWRMVLLCMLGCVIAVFAHYKHFDFSTQFKHDTRFQNNEVIVNALE